MTAPMNGVEVGRGYIAIQAYVDKAQIAKSAKDSGDEAGRAGGSSFSNSFANTVVSDKGFFGRVFKGADKSAGEAGSKASKGFLGKLKAGLLAGLPAVLMASAIPAVGLAGPAIGAALGAAIIAGISFAGIGAGIALVADSPEVSGAASKLKESLFGMSKEDKDKLEKDITSTTEKIAAMRKRLSRMDTSTEGGKRSAQFLREDIAEQEKILAGFQNKQKNTTNGLLKDAAKPFIEPTVQAITMLSDMFQRLAPSFTRIFQSLAPHVTTLAQGLIGGIERFMPGFEKMLVNSGPQVAFLAKSLTALGQGAGAFLGGVTDAVRNFKTLWSGEGDTGPFTNLNPIIEKIKAFGGTLVSIFNQIKTVVLENKTQFQTLINFMMGLSNILWSAVGPVFQALGAAIKAVIGILGGLIDFFAGVFTGDWKRAGDGLHKIWFSLWEGIKGILNNVGIALLNILKGIWGGIRGTVMGFVNWFVGNWKTLWNGAKNDVYSAGNGIKNFFAGIGNSIASTVRGMGNRFVEFKDRTIAAFSQAKDGVAKVWGKLRDVAKAPVNFVIDPVYANIRRMWNGLASKVGLGQLGPIAKFAKGGIAPGTGNRDTVPAMLTPGEGILTVDEMRKIGGRRGFEQLRNQIQYFKDGGIVGWVKDKVGGAVRGAIYPGAKSVADRFIYPLINRMAGGDNFSGLMRGGARTLVDGALSWIKGDDKKNALTGGNVGYKRMMEILRSQFPGLQLISGYRPGSRTLSGNPSYHGVGRAIDVAPRRDVAAWIDRNFASQTKELITPYQQHNLLNGRRHRYTGAIWNQHNFAGGNAHNHWAMDNGGVIPPKTTAVVTNATSASEFALTKQQLKEVVGERIYNVTFNVSADDINDIVKLKDAIGNLDMQLNSGVQGY